MRFLLLLPLLSAIAGEPSVHDSDLDRLHDVCRSFGGVRQVSYAEDGMHAECREGLKLAVYAVAEW